VIRRQKLTGQNPVLVGRPLGRALGAFVSLNWHLGCTPGRSEDKAEIEALLLCHRPLVIKHHAEGRIDISISAIEMTWHGLRFISWWHASGDLAWNCAFGFSSAEMDGGQPFSVHKREIDDYFIGSCTSGVATPTREQGILRPREIVS